jgi:hypothetical protein
MWNSYDGRLEHVKTLLEMGLVSIDDKDKVSFSVVERVFRLTRARNPHLPYLLTPI